VVSPTFNNSFDSISKITSEFKANEAFFLSPKYQEAEVRQQFIDKFWDALGWDVYHQQNLNPYEREVRIEKSVIIDGRGKRADYAFFTAPNFTQVKFLAEAKKPSRNLENTHDCFQAIRYGWNSNTPISVLTDFEQFLVLDSRYKPSIETSTDRILKRFHYSEFTDEEKFSEIYFLFAREEVAKNSLEKYALTLEKPKGVRQTKLFNTSIIQPIDEEFLKELDSQRVSLARAFKSRNENLNSETLTEITQRTLDRLVFLRFLEDKLVEPESVIDNLGIKSGSAWRDFVREMPRLNQIYNGTLFKPHLVLDDPNFTIDENAFAETRDWLAHANSAYDFNTIPIHILGSIYERFLGKTIETTGTSITIVDKPEVRKAGGVYYTPEYIVRYIVENTIGKLIENKTPEEIAEMRFADIACGSGSFLLGVFDYLISYHVKYFNKTKKLREQAIKQGFCRETIEGNLQLSIHYKREILLNNIYGVDLDSQAVEVAQLSLYLKFLEEETTATKQQYLTGYREQLLPSLDKNIIHGNSLISFKDYDLFSANDEEIRKLNLMDFETEFPEVFQKGGFDAIVGNPPYVRQELFSDRKNYFQKHYITYHGVADLYVYFFERYIKLLKSGGEFGIIVANKWLRANYGESLRHWLKKLEIVEIVDFGDLPVFQGATTYPCVIRVRNKEAQPNFSVTEIGTLDFGQTSLTEYITKNQFSVRQTDLEDKGWSLSGEMTQNLLTKLRSKGIPLGEYVNGKIYYGIKTGLNEAFVIDAETRARLIAEDDRSAELIKPFLAGRDIKRYETPKAEKFLILMPKGWTRKMMRGREEKEASYVDSNTQAITVILPSLLPQIHAWKWLKENYSAIAEHLEPYAKSAEKRCDKGDFWWELRACDYYDEFNKPKISYAEIATRGQFYLDEINSHVDTTAFIFGSSEKYLLAILNSKLTTFIFSNLSSTIRGGFLRWKTIYVSQIPVRTIDFTNPKEKAAHDKIVEFVQKMLEIKKILANTHTNKDKTFYQRYCESIDNQIDELVFDLYDLSENERKIIKEN
jgi:predicted type IV restriction endonuclease